MKVAKFRPMARAVIGGLVCPTFISLLIIPAIYYEFDLAFVKAGEVAENEAKNENI